MTEYKNLYQTYETLTGLLLENEEHLPQYLCTECTQKLLNCARFRSRSLRAHLVLLNIVKKNGCITTESIQSINEIKSPLSPALMYNETGHELVIEIVKEENSIHSEKQQDALLERIAVDSIKVEKNDGNNSAIAKNEEKVKNDTTSLALYENFVKVEANNLTKHDPVNDDDKLVFLPNLYGSGIVNCVKVENDDASNHSLRDIEQNSNPYSTGSVEVRKDLLKIEFITDNEAHCRLPADILSCDVCPYQCTNDIQFMNHLEAHKSSKLFYKNYLSNQVNEDSDRKPYCNVCCKGFSGKSALRRHLRIHGREKPYSCDVCNERFSKERTLRTHLRIHYGDMPYRCDKCNKRFSRNISLKQHLQTHSDDKPYICDICKKGFKRKSNVELHLRTHYGVKPYSCDICNKKFTEMGSLRKHSRIHTGEKPYSCDICKRTFKLSSTLRGHLQIHSEERPHSCHICNKGFRLKSTLRRHILMHFGETPYLCNTFDKSDCLNGTPKTTLPEYSEKKPFFCDLCKKGFNEKNTFVKHLINHPGKKLYICDICNKAFSVKYNLQNHMLIHSGVKPHICDICNKRFADRTTLRNHSRTHSGEKPYLCQVCNKGFARKDGLNRHSLTHSEKR